MTTGHRVRDARPDDAPLLAALGIQVWLHTYATDGITATIADFALATFTADRFTTTLARDDTRLLVAEIDARLVGYAVIRRNAVCPVATEATIELATLYVQAPFVGRGIGSALLAHAAQVARRWDAGALWLTAYAGNGPALAFYARRGYRSIGSTTFRIGDTDHDNVVLAGPA